MKIIIKIVLFSVLIAQALANTPPKESNIDLRSNREIFSILEEKGFKYVLEKSAANHFFLKRNKGKVEELIKISNQKAQQIDDQFVAFFIDIKYMMESFSGKNCSIFYSLSMRGERSEICKKEKQKKDKALKLISIIENNF